MLHFLTTPFYILHSHIHTLSSFSSSSLIYRVPRSGRSLYSARLDPFFKMMPPEQDQTAPVPARCQVSRTENVPMHIAPDNSSSSRSLVGHKDDDETSQDERNVSILHRSLYPVVLKVKSTSIYMFAVKGAW